MEVRRLMKGGHCGMRLDGLRAERTMATLNRRLTNKEPQSSQVRSVAAGLSVLHVSVVLRIPAAVSTTLYLGVLRFLVRQSSVACWSIHRSTVLPSSIRGCVLIPPQSPFTNLPSVPSESCSGTLISFRDGRGGSGRRSQSCRLPEVLDLMRVVASAHLRIRFGTSVAPRRRKNRG